MVDVPVPTAVECAARYGIGAADTELFDGMYRAAVEHQAQYCDVDVYSDGLAEALYRRVGNLWASKAHTLGIMDTGLDGMITYVPRYDPVVDGLEGPWRRIPVA